MAKAAGARVSWTALTLGLVAASALLLAPGVARAANECGTPTGTAPSRTATCTSTHYGSGFANGIQYLNQNGLTLSVPGAATAWSVNTGTGNNGSGIVLDSDNPGGSDTDPRNLALTVGGASATNNQVAITMRASPPANAGWNNHGIKVNQQGRGTSSTTVTTHAGVTIGASSSARMNRSGIHADVWLGSGAATITNAATIYSTGAGIYLQRGGAADTTEATTIINSGDITAANIGLQLRYFAGDGTNDGAARIENTGAIVKDASGWHGAIDLEYRGTGNAEVDNKGTVTATVDSAVTPAPLTSGYGIRLRYQVNSEQLGDGAVTIKNTAAVMSTHDVLRLENNGVGAATIENSGALTATGTTGDRRGIWLEDRGTTTIAGGTTATVTNSGDITANEGIAVFVHNKNTTGDNVGIKITHSDGDIVASGGIGIKGTIGDNDDTAAANTGDINIAVTGGSVRSGSTILEAVHGQAGDVDIRVSAGVRLTSDNQHGIFANLPATNTVGGVTIDNAGEITTARTGIYVRRLAPTGAGAISVTNSGPIKKTGSANWMAILVEDKGTGDVTVTNRGAIGEASAMHEHGIRVDKQDGASGSVRVKSSGVVVAAQRGILINVNEGLAKIDVTGGSFDVGNTIVEAKNLGAGNVEIDVAESVTLTSSEQHGVFVELGASNALGDIYVDNKGTITTPKTGIYVRRQAPNGAGDISVTNSGHIKKTVVDGAINWQGIRINDKGIGNVTVTNSGNVGEADRRHGTGIWAEKTGAAGDVTITSSGGTVMSGGRGIFALVKGPADDTPTNTGIAKIAVTGGSVVAGGVAVEAKNFFEAGNIDIAVAEDVTLTSERDHGIFAEVTSDNTRGTVTIDQKGAITTPKTGIYVRRCEDDYGCESNGAIRITNSGDIKKSSVSSWMGIFVAEKGLGPVTVTNSGDISGVDAVADSIHDHGILVQGQHEGDVRAGAFTVRNSGDLTAALFGIWVPVKEADRRIVIEQSGAITARKGIHVQVGRDSKEGETRAAADQPLIDIAWTGGAFSHGTETAEDDVDKLGAGSVAGALDVNLEYVTHETILRDGPAVGIEAQVMTWHSVATEVAKGDDPGEIADLAAQMALLAESGDASRRVAILRDFRAALKTEVDIPESVFDGIKTGAKRVDDLTDAEIVTWLSTDDDDTRTLLRNVLAQSLSEAEEAVLRAVVADTGLDAALDAVEGASDDYKTAVKALLNRYHVGDIRIAMTGGSITSRGDGIRAYYATQHDNNGGISVTVADGASVTGGVAGVYVANAGDGLRIEKKYAPQAVRDANPSLGDDDPVTVANYLNQVVRVDGTVTGGTDAAVHLAGGGALIVGRTGRVMPGSSGRAILVNDPGPAIIYIAGAVQGGAGAAAVDLTGGSSVTGSSVTVGQGGMITGETGIRLPAASTVENYGTISSTAGANGILIDFQGTGTSVVRMYPGAVAAGKIQLDGRGGDLVDLSDMYIGDVNVDIDLVDETGSEVNLGDNYREPATERPVIKEPTMMRPGDMLVMDPDKGRMMGINTSVFALTDDMLSDLTGSIHGAVVESGMRPGIAGSVQQTVWATPFGGARDQNGDGTVAGATHYFGGGMIGTNWGTTTLRVGGFLGGSVGQLDVGRNQGGQAMDVDVQTIFGGVYAQRAVGDVIYDARMLVGRMTHDSTRRGGSLGMDTAEVEYHSIFLSPEVGIATNVALMSKLHATPRLRVRYAGLFTDGFRESGKMTNTWDLQVEERTLHLVEGRAEVGIPFALENGGRINPRVGVEGRWLLAGSEIKGTARGNMPFNRDAGGDDAVVTGTVGVGVSLPVADSMTLVGSFDGALTTEDAWRAMGYMGLSYSF